MRKAKRCLLASFLVLVALLLSGYFLFRISKSNTFQFFGEIIPRVNTDQKVVALTLDDAPSPFSDEVLGILAEKNVKATFYVIGKNLEEYPQEGKNIVNSGHELGNHSYSHQRFLLKSLSFVDTEIQRTNQSIREAGYQGEITFRPPYGKKLFILPWYLDRHNIKTITWDVQPDSYTSNLEEGEEKVQFLVNHTLQNTQPGSIILLHPFCNTCASDRQALGQIIDGLQEKGYRFVTISELLKTY
jgi:peptidoglycan/xylan/chitin deacetylase (PgdA/CDA1 family)